MTTDNKPIEWAPREWPETLWVGQDDQDTFPWYVATLHHSMVERGNEEYVRRSRDAERRRALADAILDEHHPAETPDGKRFILVPVDLLNRVIEYLRET